MGRKTLEENQRGQSSTIYVFRRAQSLLWTLRRKVRKCPLNVPEYPQPLHLSSSDCPLTISLGLSDEIFSSTSSISTIKSIFQRVECETEAIFRSWEDRCSIRSLQTLNIDYILMLQGKALSKFYLLSSSSQQCKRLLKIPGLQSQWVYFTMIHGLNHIKWPGGVCVSIQCVTNTPSRPHNFCRAFGAYLHTEKQLSECAYICSTPIKWNK